MSIMDVLNPRKPPKAVGARMISFGMQNDQEVQDRKRQLQREHWRNYYRRTLGPKRRAK